MAKYRGSDGWVHDDSVGNPQRYENKENIKEGVAKEQPPTKQLDPSKRPRHKCPNCDLSATWRRLEGHCEACGWGKNQKKPSDSDSGACCAFLGVVIVIPLVAAGIGYGLMGGAGLLIGGGIGLSIPIGLIVLALNSRPEKPSNP